MEEIKEKEDETAKIVLTNLAKEFEADLTVVGYHGRKGEKEDPTVMGSAVQFMSIHSYTPTLIVKRQVRREDRPNGYALGICIDGSRKSMAALKLLCEMRSQNDRIEVLICE